MIGPSNFILWIVIGTFAACCLFILVLLARVMLRRNTRSYATPSAFSRQTRHELLWTITPLMVGAEVVAVPSLRLLYFENTSPAADLTIKVTGKMWSWTYEYPDYGNFSFDAPMLSNNAAEKARKLSSAGHGR